jgi:hypothetical protein
MENNDHFLVQVFFYRSISNEKIIEIRFKSICLTILHATRRPSDLRRAAWTVAKPPLPSI